MDFVWRSSVETILRCTSTFSRLSTHVTRIEWTVLCFFGFSRLQKATILPLSSFPVKMISSSARVPIKFLWFWLAHWKKNGNWVGPTRQGITEQFARYINSHIDWQDCFAVQGLDLWLSGSASDSSIGESLSDPFLYKGRSVATPKMLLGNLLGIPESHQSISYLWKTASESLFLCKSLFVWEGVLLKVLYVLKSASEKEITDKVCC